MASHGAKFGGRFSRNEVTPSRAFASASLRISTMPDSIAAARTVFASARDRMSRAIRSSTGSSARAVRGMLRSRWCFPPWRSW